MVTSGGPAIIHAVVSATRLDQSHAALIAGFLERDAVANIFALGVLEQWGVTGNSGTEWWGHMTRTGGLDAVVLAEGYRPGLGHALVVPMGAADGVAALASSVGGRDGAAWMVGDARATAALAGALSGAEPVLDRRQLLMALEIVRPGPTAQVREAVLGDLAWTSTAARAVNEEDLGPGVIDMEGQAFLRQIEASIASGAEWLGMGRCYRAKVGTRCRHGAQLGGIWVPPERRGRGIGQSATRSLCQHLLGSVPRVTLHVDAENTRALRCYEAVGFQAVRDFQLWVR